MDIDPQVLARAQNVLADPNVPEEKKAWVREKFGQHLDMSLGVTDGAGPKPKDVVGGRGSMSSLMQLPTKESAQAVDPAAAVDPAERAILEAERRFQDRQGKPLEAAPVKPMDISTRPVGLTPGELAKGKKSGQAPIDVPDVYFDDPSKTQGQRDIEYANMVDRGVREGRTVLRKENLDDESTGGATFGNRALDKTVNELVNAGGDILGAADRAKAAIGGADQSISAGLVTRGVIPGFESLGLAPPDSLGTAFHDAQERNAGTSMAGGFFGSVAPAGVANTVGRGALSAAERIVPSAGKKGLRLVAARGAQGALAGGVGGVAQGAAEDAVDATLGGQDISRDEFAARMLGRGGVGMALGGVAGGLGGLGARQQTKLREEPGIGVDVKTLENAGGKLRPTIEGVKPPERVQEFIEQSGRMGGYPEDRAVDAALPYIERRAKDRSASVGKFNREQSQAFKAEHGAEAVDVPNAMSAARELIESQRGVNGEEIPLADVGRIKQVMGKLVEAKAVRTDDPMLDDIDPQWTMSPETAKRLGIDVEMPKAREASSILDPYGDPAIPAEENVGHTIVFQPRKMTPEEFDLTLDNLAAKADISGDNYDKGVAAGLKKIAAGLLKDRDQIADGAYSRMKSQQSARIGSKQDELGSVGFDEDVRRVDATSPGSRNTRKSMREALLKHGDRGQADDDRFRLSLAAHDEEARGALDSIAALKATQRLRGKSSPRAIVSEGGLKGYGALDTLRLRLDPLWGALDAYSPQILGTATGTAATAGGHTKTNALRKRK